MPKKDEFKQKDDGSRLPKRPPPTLKTPGEKSAYRRIIAMLEKTMFSSGADLEAVVLGAQRLAHLEELRAIRSNLSKDKWHQKGGNGQLVPHPIFAQITKGENAWASSLRSLLLTAQGRSSTRLTGPQLEQKSDYDPRANAR